MFGFAPPTARRSTAMGAGLCVAAFLALAATTGPAESAAVADPTIVAAGDIACDPLNGGFNGGAGTTTDCLEMATSNLLPGAEAVLPLGDEQYGCGGVSAFGASYDPSWGKAKAVTHPVPGNHEYQTSGGTDCSPVPDAAGYYGYFGSAAGEPTKGYYSYDVGQWHLIAHNTECVDVGGCDLGSPQEQWLRADLASHSSSPCTLAYWHRPRFYSEGDGADTTFDQFWRDLYAAHADVVLNGHMHFYERFALQNPGGQADANGVREFIVGTGGESYIDPSATKAANSQVTSSRVFGVLQMTLHPASYDWSFLRVPNSPVAFTDSGSTACHNAATGPDTVPPTSTIRCNNAACSSTAYAAPVSVTLAATDTGGSGVNTTTYTTDGTDPVSSSTASVYTQPLTLSATTTVRFASRDNAGNQETPLSQLVQVGSAADTTAPVTSITCQSVTCSTGWYTTSNVTVALSATDSGGSGVRTTLYTTDGTNPRTSATAVTYSGPFALQQTSTVKFSSTDNAGNAETTKSRLVKLDASPPSVTLTSPADGSSFKKHTSVVLSATAADTGTGGGIASGISRVRFYRGATLIGTVSASPYSTTWNTKSLAVGTYTLTAVAQDVAGNSTTSQPVQIRISS
jgi:hypothetical protein